MVHTGHQVWIKLKIKKLQSSASSGSDGEYDLGGLYKRKSQITQLNEGFFRKRTLGLHGTA